MPGQMMSFAETFIANGTLELLFAFSSIGIGGNFIFMVASHVVDQIARHSCFDKFKHRRNKLGKFDFVENEKVVVIDCIATLTEADVTFGAHILCGQRKRCGNGRWDECRE